jgi:mitogen-activated protein kinase kinase 1
VHGVVGKGSGGVVQRATHARTGAELAVKVVQMNVQAEVRKNLIAELRTLHQSAHPHVVPYHGAFFSDGSVSILLDYMNVGSLSDVAKVLGKIPERELASVSRCVLRGLAYLHGDMRVIHRDVKPSNVLVNDAGEVKISDFGVSGQLANSVTKCNSWVGTVTYMSPERISGGTYGFDSDVWSFALSIVECALGRFPYPPPADEEAPSGASGGEGDGADAAHKPRQPMGFWDLLDHIVEEPPPTLPRGGGHDFSDAFRDAIASCLKKSPKERVSASELLKHEWFEAHPEEGCDLAAFFADVGERRAKDKEEKACKTQKRR